jgi:uncharacterized membrane protein (Fun14 family)
MVENKKDPVEAALDKLKPVFQQLTFGGVMGYCSGMALKKIGKAAAFAAGIGFIAVQTAVSAGYIEVDWNKVKGTALKPLDSVRYDCIYITYVYVYIIYILLTVSFLFFLTAIPDWRWQH